MILLFFFFINYAQWFRVYTEMIKLLHIHYFFFLLSAVPFACLLFRFSSFFFFIINEWTFEGLIS